MLTSCTDGDSGDSASEVADTPALPTCAQIAAVLKVFIEADSLDPVNLVLTEEDVEHQTWSAWEDKPSGKSVLIAAGRGDIAIQEIRDQQGHWDPSSYERPEYFQPDEPGATDAIFVINDGSAEVYEPGCEVNLTYTSTFWVKVIGEEYVIDQVKDIALRVATLMG